MMERTLHLVDNVSHPPIGMYHTVSWFMPSASHSRSGIHHLPELGAESSKNPNQQASRDFFLPASTCQHINKKKTPQVLMEMQEKKNIRSHR